MPPLYQQVSSHNVASTVTPFASAGYCGPHKKNTNKIIATFPVPKVYKKMLFALDLTELTASRHAGEGKEGDGQNRKKEEVRTGWRSGGIYLKKGVLHPSVPSGQPSLKCGWGMRIPRHVKYSHFVSCLMIMHAGAQPRFKNWRCILPRSLSFPFRLPTPRHHEAGLLGLIHMDVTW